MLSRSSVTQKLCTDAPPLFRVGEAAGTWSLSSAQVFAGAPWCCWRTGGRMVLGDDRWGSCGARVKLFTRGKGGHLSSFKYRLCSVYSSGDSTVILSDSC